MLPYMTMPQIATSAILLLLSTTLAEGQHVDSEGLSGAGHLMQKDVACISLLDGAEGAWLHEVLVALDPALRTKLRYSTFVPNLPIPALEKVAPQLQKCLASTSSPRTSAAFSSFQKLSSH